MGLENTVNEVEMAYFLDEDYQGKGYATEALSALFNWCMSVSEIPYMILTIDCANKASCKVAERAKFELFEKGLQLDISSQTWKVTVISIIVSIEYDNIL